MQSGLERGARLLGASDLLAVANLNAADVLRRAPAVFYYQSIGKRRTELLYNVLMMLLFRILLQPETTPR